MGPTPPETQSQTLPPSEDGYVPPEGPGPCRWQDIWTIAEKTVATERHIPRGLVGLWQNICSTLLENPAPLDQEGPDHSDLFFVLPKLILGRAQGAETRKERLARLNRNFQHASQGEWDLLMQDALARPEVTSEADDLHPLLFRKTDSHPT